MPHDNAIAFAASHRLSVNQALGVVEVRDESAIERIQPSLEAAAEKTETRLFAHVSDADLGHLGIDAKVLPVVRLLASEAHLGAMQTIQRERYLPFVARTRAWDHLYVLYSVTPSPFLTKG